MIPTDFKRLFLRGIAWDAEDQSLTLAEALKAAARAQLQQTPGGRVLVGTSANNQTVQFALPSAGDGVTPTEVTALCEQLITLYERSESAIKASGVAIPSDSQLLAEMLNRLQAVRAMGGSSFVNLRSS